MILEGSQDPHNVHAALRTAEALGVQDIHLVRPQGNALAAARHAASVARGVTQGSHLWLSVRRHATIEEAIDGARSEGRTIWAADPGEGAEPVSALAASNDRIAVVFGNETAGLSSDASRLADHRFRLSLVGFAGSLNLSVAVAMTLWELRREELDSERAGDLSDEEREELRRAWYDTLLARRRRREADVAHWLERSAAVEAEARRRPRLSSSERSRGEADGR